MTKQTLVLGSIIVLVVAGIGIGLGLALSGHDGGNKDTVIRCKAGTDNCSVEGQKPKGDDHVGPGYTAIPNDPPSEDPWQKDQRDFGFPWAQYDGHKDIVNLRQCNPIGEQDMCWTVANHSKWTLDYELDFTFWDASGAKLGTDQGSTIDVEPGQTSKEEDTNGGSVLIPEGTVRATLDDVQVVGSQCADSGECDGYEQHGGDSWDY